MRGVGQTAVLIALLTLTAMGADSKAKPVSPENRNSMIIIFKDGHQQTIPMSDVSRIEFSAPASSTSAPTRPTRFVGKWKVGDGAGGTFFITLERNGEAKKSIGAGHGTWTVVEGEARVAWDDGWHDAIRRAGDGYEKAAYSPGRSFSDDPSNVEDAKSTEPI